MDVENCWSCIRRSLWIALAALLLVAGCAAPPSAAPTPMIHHSSMGDLESDWQVAQIPEPYRGDWRVQSPTGEPLHAEFGPDYALLLFRLAESPADCRVLLDESTGLREIGTMPYVYLENDELIAVFTGDFHLTYTLRLHQAADGQIVGAFEHAGSGVVYFSGDVRLVREP